MFSLAKIRCCLKDKEVKLYVCLGRCPLLLSSQLNQYMSIRAIYLGLIADPVIKAIARLEFEDGLRMGVLPGGCWGP